MNKLVQAYQYQKKTEELFNEASEQLDAIVQTTEKAIDNIMGMIEKQL